MIAQSYIVCLGILIRVQMMTNVSEVKFRFKKDDFCNSVLLNHVRNKRFYFPLVPGIFLAELLLKELFLNPEFYNEKDKDQGNAAKDPYIPDTDSSPKKRKDEPRVDGMADKTVPVPCE